MGDAPATSDDDLVGPAAAAEDAFGQTALTPTTVPTIHRLADLDPQNLALMHGPSFVGSSSGAATDQLRSLADEYGRRLAG